MKRRFIVRHRATIDVAEICDYLTSHSQSTAVKFVAGYLATLQALRKEPKSGHRLHLPDESGDEFCYKRVRLFDNYLLIYRYDDSITEILRAVHSSRDLLSLLTDRS